jgi:hypothetical protein
MKGSIIINPGTIPSNKEKDPVIPKFRIKEGGKE